LGSGAHSLPTPIKLRMPVNLPGSQTAKANLRSQEGNNPDRQLRPLNLG